MLSLFILLIITFKKRYLFSPWTITLGVWFVELYLYLVANHGLNESRGYFEFGLILWITSFCIASFISYSLFLQKKSLHNQIIVSQYNKKIFNIMFCLAIVCVPISAYLTYKYVTTHALSDNIFFDLRKNATNEEKGIELLKYVSYVALVPLLAICNAKVINWKKFIILFSLNIVLALTTMAKTSLFTVIISSIFILVNNKKVKPTVFLYVFGLFIVLTIAFNGIRSFSGDINAVDINSVLYTYILSPIPAFDYMADKITITYDGSNTFRFFFALVKSFGADVTVQNTVQDFVLIPTPTNVFTIFWQYYKDFGYFGIFIFGIFNGFIYGYVYSQINLRPSMKLFYSYLVVTLFLQFFNEIFWVTLSIVVQIYILSNLIYLNMNKKHNVHE